MPPARKSSSTMDKASVAAVEEMIETPVIPVVPQAVHVDPSESVLRQRIA